MRYPMSLIAHPRSLAHTVEAFELRDDRRDCTAWDVLHVDLALPFPARGTSLRMQQILYSNLPEP